MSIPSDKRAITREDVLTINNVKKLQDICLKLIDGKNIFEKTNHRLKILYRKEQAKNEQLAAELSTFTKKVPIFTNCIQNLQKFTHDFGLLLRARVSSKISTEESNNILKRKVRKLTDILKQQEMVMQTLEKIEIHDNKTNASQEKFDTSQNEAQKLRRVPSSSSTNSTKRSLRQEKSEDELKIEIYSNKLEEAQKENEALRKINFQLQEKLLENEKIIEAAHSPIISARKSTNSPSPSSIQSTPKAASVKNAAKTPDEPTKKASIKSDKKSFTRQRSENSIRTPKTPATNLATRAKPALRVPVERARRKTDADKSSTKSAEEDQFNALKDELDAKREEYNRELEIRTDEKKKIEAKVHLFEAQIAEIGKEIDRLRKTNEEGKKKIEGLEKKIEEGTEKIKAKKLKLQHQNEAQAEIINKKENQLKLIETKLQNAPIRKSLGEFMESEDDFMSQKKSSLLPSSSSEEFADLRPKAKISPPVLTLVPKAKMLAKAPSLSAFVDDGDADDDFENMEVVPAAIAHQRRPSIFADKPICDSENEFADLPAPKNNAAMTLSLLDGKEDDDNILEFNVDEPPELDSPAFDDDEDDVVIGYTPPDKADEPALLKLADAAPDIGQIFDDDKSTTPLTLRPQTKRFARSESLSHSMRSRPPAPQSRSPPPPQQVTGKAQEQFLRTGPIRIPSAGAVDPAIFDNLDDDDDDAALGRTAEPTGIATDGFIPIYFDETNWFDFGRLRRDIHRHNAIMEGVGQPEPMTPRDEKAIAAIIDSIPEEKFI